MIKTVLMKMIGCAGFAMLVACAEQPPTPTYSLPAGPTPAEVDNYAAAQATYRSAQAVGNGDAVTQALYTFSQIPQEILSRQDPRLFDAQAACARYRVAETYPRNGMRTSFEPQFRYACVDIEFRYTDATEAIRKDLDARIAAADRAIIAKASDYR